ncbi:Zn-ribbon domain-containing OB-fold protein [candidate division WOR-3 bacterium]|nr:Zn-ribbon domain-containing OB-fold protein [candidate division WOR-3 bacterium]MCK4575703.1 Zn-ribbon domain-containing OB-fold protein [candidate division WOR-3 bacterium]
MSSPKIWRQRIERYRLLGQKCKGCGKVYFPKRLVCPECGGRDFGEESMPETGKIVTYTTVYVGPKFMENDTPYVVAIIEFANGVRVTTQVVDVSPEEVSAGKEVKFVFRKLKDEGKTGVIVYGYKAQLV